MKVKILDCSECPMCQDMGEIGGSGDESDCNRYYCKAADRVIGEFRHGVNYLPKFCPMREGKIELELKMVTG